MRPITRGNVLTLIQRTARTAVASVVVVLAATASPASAQDTNLASAETFGVLAGSTVTNSGSTSVAGDVGVGSGGSITGTAITLSADGALHEGDAVALQALLDASEVYDDLVGMTCTSNLTGQNLGGMSLASGVYCFDADAQLTGGALTLTGTGPWIFRVGGALTTASPVTVSTSTQACNGSRVFWVVEGDVTIGAATAFVGNVLSQQDVTLGSGATVDGRAVALDAASTVTLDSDTITPCSFGKLLPVHDPVKVTGGGQIHVPDPDSSGFANYGFNALPGATSGASATGHLNYLNHVTGLHVNGTVTDVDVVTIDPGDESDPSDDAPKMVRFSGTCTNGPDCTFSVTVEDNGEPGRDDRFGIVVAGTSDDETTPDRVVRNGNIQVHLGLTTSLNAQSYMAGDVMSVSVSMTPGTGAPRVDAYLVLRLPDGQLLSWTPRGLVSGLVPMAQNVTPFNFTTEITRFTVPVGAPAGTYTWLSGHTATGTLNLVSEISARQFTIR